MDLPTLRQGSRERKNATGQIKNMTLAMIWIQVLRHIAPTLYQLSYGVSWQKLSLIHMSFTHLQVTPPLSFFRVDLLNDSFLFIDSIFFFYECPQLILFLLYSILFGYLYAVIRINVVECFFDNPSRNWTFQRFARVAEKERTQKNTQLHWF